MDNTNLSSALILNKFYKDLSKIIDIAIVNTKQREAVDYEILRLMNQYFFFELEETEEE